VPGCYRSHFQTARHCFPWKYRIISTCTKNPHPKKTIWWHFMNVFLRGGRGSWGRGRFKGSLFGKSYETKYCVCRFVTWHDVWRHLGLSDAKNSNKKGTESKKLFKFYCFFAMFWYLHFCSVCTWFFEDNCCKSSWILVLFFAFRSVYQSWSSCQVKRWYQWFSRSYSTSKFDFMPFLGVCGPYAAPRYKSNLSLPQLLGTMFWNAQVFFFSSENMYLDDGSCSAAFMHASVLNSGLKSSKTLHFFHILY